MCKLLTCKRRASYEIANFTEYSTPFKDAGAMEQHCVMGNSEAIVVKTAISIYDISYGTRNLSYSFAS